MFDNYDIWIHDLLSKPRRWIWSILGLLECENCGSMAVRYGSSTEYGKYWCEWCSNCGMTAQAMADFEKETSYRKPKEKHD